MYTVTEWIKKIIFLELFSKVFVMKNKTIFTFNMHVLNNSTLTPHTGKFQGELLTLVEAFSFPLQILNYNLQRIQ